MEEKNLSKNTENLQKIWISDPQFLALCSNIDAFVAAEIFCDSSLVFILACSGGPDSVFAAYYLYYKKQSYPCNVVLAYFDHEWREESKTEVAFCRALANSLGFLFEARTATSQKQFTQKKYNGSKEATARELRYAFLRELQEKYNAHYIVLGHHKDDQIENFFIRMIRGSSLSGLCGMNIIDGDLFRPLLTVSKSEILSCLNTLQISYCLDASNQNPSYLRNRVRNQIIPTFLRVDSRSINNIEQLMLRLQNAEQCLAIIAQDVVDTITEQQKEGKIILNIPLFLSLSLEMQYRVLVTFLIKNKITVTFSERFFQEIVRFMKNNKSKKHVLSNNATLIKEKDFIFFVQKELD